jgi:hypothetical protein
LKWYNFNIGERGDLKKENMEHNLGFVLRLEEGIGLNSNL